MTSVNTNVAAITALRTLQQTNNQLDATQGRISTGLKIGEAKDNAAYWAISTTLKSDNKSLGTVKDALGLGSATVDVAYQGLNKAKDVLDEIKSKLTAASQAGVDKNVIQAEIGELQKQLVSIAGSSVFSGENWLSVNSSAVDYDSTKKIVASFARDSNNSVTIGTVDVSIGNVALFDSSTVAGTGGILDKTVNLRDANGRDLTIGGTAVTTGNSSVGGLTAENATGVLGSSFSDGGNITGGVAASAGTHTSTGAPATVTLGTTGSLDVTKLKAGDRLSFTVTLQGTAQTKTLTYAGTTGYVANSGNFTSAAELATELDTALGASDYAVSQTGGTLTIARTGTASETLTLNEFKINDASGTLRLDRGFIVNPAAGTGTSYYAATAKQVETRANVTLQTAALSSTDKVNFDFAVGGTSLKVSVAAVGTDDATRLSNLLANLNADAGFAKVATASLNGSKLVIKAASAATVGITSVAFSDADGKDKVLAGSGFDNVAQKATATSDSFTGAIALDADDSISFDITVNGASTPSVVRIDKALVDKTLTRTTGQILSAAEYKEVMNAALQAANITNVTVAQNGTDNTKLDFQTTTVGTDKTIVMTAAAASKGGSLMSVEKMDISDAALTKLNVASGADISKVLSAYIKVVNDAINSVTTAASNLGAVASRIDMQKSFVNTLMDTIDKGVGGLIDADMSEESTKLQALQVKQSLGVQALSIANQSSQNILRLFQ